MKYFWLTMALLISLQIGRGIVVAHERDAYTQGCVDIIKLIVYSPIDIEENRKLCDQEAHNKYN